jgi:hypothetical protein
MQTKKRRLFLLPLAMLVSTVGASANTLTFDLGSVFNGGTPGSSPPYLTALFEDTAANTVKLTLSSHLNVASEFFSDFDFNVTGFVPSALAIVQNAGDIPQATIFHTTQNGQNLTGGGAAGFGFDIEFRFPTSNSGPRFDNSDVLTFTLTGTGLTSSAFDAVNTGSAAARAGAHVQGFANGQSGAIKDGNDQEPPPPGVPEPATTALLGGGMIALGLYRRTKRA